MPVFPNWKVVLDLGAPISQRNLGLGLRCSQDVCRVGPDRCCCWKEQSFEAETEQDGIHDENEVEKTFRSKKNLAQACGRVIRVTTNVLNR